MRFGSNFGRAMPAPTSTSVPRALELRERRLHARGRCPSTRARRRTARRRGRAASPGVDELLGLDDAGAELLAERRGGSPCGSLTTMSSTPSAFSAATERKPIGPPPVTSQRVPGRAPPACVMPCSATASGSVSAACLSERSSGTRSASAARDRLVAGERALPVAVVGADPAPLDAERRAAGEAVLALAALGRLARRSTRSPTAQPVDAGADRGDRARELVALDHVRCGRPTRRGSAGRSRRSRSG